MDERGELWVFLEQEEDRVCRVSLELLGKGRQLADRLAVRLTALVLAQEPYSAARQAAEYGADRILSVAGAAYAHYSTEPYTQTLWALAEKYRPSALLIGATSLGRDLAPRLACRLQTGLTADCTSVEAAEDGLLLWTRPAFGGNILSTNICPDHRPQMGTVRPGVFPLPARTPGRRAEHIREQVPLGPSPAAVRFLETIRVPGEKAVRLSEARIIVSGGRGLRSGENFRLLEDLAQALGGSVGASRAAVDAGWISPLHQVGQTGRTVSPQLYIACGISGAIQHLIGMSSAGLVVAINRDPDAPIFRVADFAIVGDLFEVVPAITRALKARGRPE